MTVRTEADLFRRGTETLVASWEEYSRGAAGAFVQRFSGVAVAVFTNEPERAVYNNALLTRDLLAAERTTGIDAMEAAYAAAGVARFAAWVHESDEAMRADLEQRGYTLDTSERHGWCKSLSRFGGTATRAPLAALTTPDRVLIGPRVGGSCGPDPGLRRGARAGEAHAARGGRTPRLGGCADRAGRVSLEEEPGGPHFETGLARQGRGENHPAPYLANHA